MCEKLNDVSSEKKSVFKKLFKTKEEYPLTAELAYYEAKHGQGSYKPLSERITDKQNAISDTIRSKFAPSIVGANQINNSAFHCVVDIEEDLVAYSNDVLQPFKDSGFEVIDLSKECKSLTEENGVFLISWKNVFKNIRHE